MTETTFLRQPHGIPAGGEFAPRTRADGEVTLTNTLNPSTMEALLESSANLSEEDTSWDDATLDSIIRSLDQSNEPAVPARNTARRQLNAETMNEIMNGPGTEVHQQPAGGGTDAENIRALFESPGGISYGLESALGGNENTPEDILISIASNHFETHHLTIAQNPSAPASLLAVFANDTYDYTRVAVAKHANTSPASVALLMKDRSSTVRAALAGRTDLSDEQVAILAKDAVPQVRTGVARQLSLSAEIRAQLSTDADEYVRWVAKPAKI